MDLKNLYSRKLYVTDSVLRWTDKKRNLVKKKVRFSEDVVEPSGDNVAYRRRHALAFTARQPRSQEPHKTGCQNKRINYSKSDANQRRVLANIPPNRMALYVGICNDRSQRRLLSWMKATSCLRLALSLHWNYKIKKYQHFTIWPNAKHIQPMQCNKRNSICTSILIFKMSSNPLLEIYRPQFSSSRQVDNFPQFIFIIRYTSTGFNPVWRHLIHTFNIF